jgi:hypothetical protein
MCARRCDRRRLSTVSAVVRVAPAMLTPVVAMMVVLARPFARIFGRRIASGIRLELRLAAGAAEQDVATVIP